MHIQTELVLGNLAITLKKVALGCRQFLQKQVLVSVLVLVLARELEQVLVRE